MRKQLTTIGRFKNQLTAKRNIHQLKKKLTLNSSISSICSHKNQSEINTQHTEEPVRRVQGKSKQSVTTTLQKEEPIRNERTAKVANQKCLLEQQVISQHVIVNHAYEINATSSTSHSIDLQQSSDSPQAIRSANVSVIKLASSFLCQWLLTCIEKKKFDCFFQLTNPLTEEVKETNPIGCRLMRNGI